MIFSFLVPINEELEVSNSLIIGNAATLAVARLLVPTFDVTSDVCSLRLVWNVEFALQNRVFADTLQDRSEGDRFTWKFPKGVVLQLQPSSISH